MPELPEVETICQDLQKALLVDRVTGLTVYDKRLMSVRDEARWKTFVFDQRWKSFSRRGKYLWVELTNGWKIFFHLRMTGQLVVSNGMMGPPPATAGDDKIKLPRLRLIFASGKSLSLYDQRRLAEAWLLAPGQAWHTDSPPGPDALNELKLDHFVTLIKGRTTRIQPLLMDQKLIAGIGNIYAQEALFKAAIRPNRAKGIGSR